MVLRKNNLKDRVTKTKERRAKTRRSRQKHKDQDILLKILGTNADGLKTKQESFKNLIMNEKPTFFMVQET